MESWTIITDRFGGDTKSPSDEYIAAVIERMYHENHPDLTEYDYLEHSCAFIRYGFEDGPMYVLECQRNGVLRFEQWTDQDFNEEVAPAKSMENVPEKLARILFMALAKGDIESVAKAQWDSDEG
jgi:hypothetical protein